jgi:hypothetical protein
MRKTSFDSVSLAPREQNNDAWLDLDSLAEVAVTSEDPAFPIESAFTFGVSPGWRAGGGGEQTIRLAFDTPQRIKRVWLRFEETEADRTQEFSLRWRPDLQGQSQEIVRQQWNFSPTGATTEVEDYKVDLDNVGVLELAINPDVSRRDAVATLAEWRVA